MNIKINVKKEVIVSVNVSAHSSELSESELRNAVECELQQDFENRLGCFSGYAGSIVNGKSFGYSFEMESFSTKNIKTKE